MGSHDLEKADAMMHCDIPHLLTCRNEGYWDIGPLVVPGVTCCARCLETTQSAIPSLASVEPLNYGVLKLHCPGSLIWLQPGFL